MTRPLLSLSMIVRNEERTLARCLDSVRDSVDDIVIVDTGSDDATAQVAARYGARWFSVAWRRDFAWARQYAMDRTTGTWMLWLDADDVVAGAHALRPRLEQAARGTRGFSWKYITARDEYGHSICECWRERCVRNDGRFRWVGRVHEVLSGTPTAELLRDPEIRVIHQPEPRDARVCRRNLELLQEEYERGPARAPARLLLYLGLELARLGENGPALEFMQRFLERSDWPEQNYLVHLAVADTCRRLGRLDRAIDAAFEAVKIFARRPEAYFSLAETAYFRQEWDAVVHWTDVGRGTPAVDTVCVTNPMDTRYRWIIHYTNALFRTGRPADALRWTRHALELCPADRWHRSNLAFFGQQLDGAA